MTDISTTVDRIKSADTVPSPDSLPSGAMSSAALLARIDERSKTMTDTLTPIRQVDPSKPPSRGRGPLLAFAVAAVLILVIGVTTFNVLTGDSQPEVADPVPTTTVAPTTTTAAPPTTLAPLEGLLPANTPPIEVVEALQAEWAAGDIAGAEALIRPDSHFFTDDLASGVAPEILYRSVTGMTSEGECAIGTPPQLEPWTFSFATSVMVTCTDTLTSGLEPGVVVGGGTTAYEVADGWIVEFIIVDYQGALDERTGRDAYRNWVQEFFPTEFATVFNPTTLTMILETEEAQAKHAELIPFFVGDTGPRGELALPADTPLLDVVNEFVTRYDAADIAGYEALLHPASGYETGSNSAGSWFAAVTGMTTERTCTEISPTQVRCEEIAISGLVPGVVVAWFPSTWNGRAGWIWTVEFEEGAELDFANPATALGVAEYRSWVQANDAEAFATLFIGAVSMRLDTPEVRAQHQATIAAYLAATG